MLRMTGHPECTDSHDHFDSPIPNSPMVTPYEYVVLLPRQRRCRECLCVFDIVGFPLWLLALADEHKE